MLDMMLQCLESSFSLSISKLGAFSCSTSGLAFNSDFLFFAFVTLKLPAQGAAVVQLAR